ncbi:MAG: 5'-methylthioadenosine phosphorylase, partial [Pseudomonadota bacterium]
MLAVIGGSGLYALDGLEIEAEHDIDTPFGKPSDIIFQGIYEGQSILFLSRHGAGHKFLPHEVNYRANIFALKSLGARKILGVSAAGSLREELKPG